MYDIRKECTYPPLCYDFSQVDKFLARSDIRAELGIPEHVKWEECNKLVHLLLLGDWIDSFQKDVEVVLAHKRRGEIAFPVHGSGYVHPRVCCC